MGEIMEYQYFEEHLSGATSKCDDCGYVGKDYVEPLPYGDSTLEDEADEDSTLEDEADEDDEGDEGDEADVLCPKCKSYNYFCI
jgi:hypothetical protein